MENGQWSNNACEGYCIMAMQAAGFSDDDIGRVLDQFARVFDFNSVKTASDYRIDYC